MDLTVMVVYRGDVMMSENPIELLKELAGQNDNNMNLEDGSIDNMLDVYFELFITLSKSIKDECFLKGNILLNKILPSTARSTSDLDVSIVDEELYSSVVVPELIKFGENSIKFGKASSYVIRDNITDKKSGGIVIKNENGVDVYSVDVSLSKASLYGKTTYAFDGVYVIGSSIEKILCDKCLSTLSRKRFRRIKDFYDLFIIITSELQYDSNKILQLMRDKVSLEELEELFNNLPFSDQVMTEATKAWSKFKISSFTNEPLVKPQFIEVLNSIYPLYDTLKLLHYKE